MKKLIILILTVLIVFGVYRAVRGGSPTPFSPILPHVSPTPAQLSGTAARTSLFMPYWTLSADTPYESYDTLIYFGVTPDNSGLDTEEAGYTALPRFLEKAGSKKKYLTLRMLDSKENFAILENPTLQQALIAETMKLAVDNDFDGVVLDLEVSALPFASVIDQITSFTKAFSQAAHNQNLHMSTLLYGDTFFRIRPFDVKAIGETSDEVTLMAYDFHKSRGNPGPNFPLSGKEIYGYDYSRLIDQFRDAIPPEKLTVTFGLFGYDWEVDKANNRVSHGEALSYNEIKQQFIDTCVTTCTLSRDSSSAESSITYTDEDGKAHTIWFEDLDSVAKKQAFLQTKGISSYSMWAYSYF